MVVSEFEPVSNRSKSLLDKPLTDGAMKRVSAASSVYLAFALSVLALLIPREH